MIVASVTSSKTFQERLNMSISPDQLFTSWTYDEDWMQRLRAKMSDMIFHQASALCGSWRRWDNSIVQLFLTFQMLSDWTDQIVTAKTHFALRKRVYSFTAAPFTMWTYGNKSFWASVHHMTLDTLSALLLGGFGLRPRRVFGRCVYVAGIMFSI